MNEPKKATENKIKNGKELETSPKKMWIEGTELN